MGLKEIDFPTFSCDDFGLSTSGSSEASSSGLATGSGTGSETGFDNLSSIDLSSFQPSQTRSWNFKGMLTFNKVEHFGTIKYCW
jgi:hypothetical protein